MRDTVKTAVDDQYRNYPGGGEHHLPPAFRGDWGAGVRIWVQPQLGALSVRNDARHASFVESGRPAGPISRVLVEDWAGEKLGITNKRIVKAIWRKLMNRGYEGMHTIYKATSPYADGVGPSLHAELGRILQERLSKMIRKYGWS